MKHKILKLTIFILLVAGIFAVFYRTFKFKSFDGIYQMTKFYEEEDNSIDLLMLGSSHMFVNANTSVLWDEYGIAGYDLCGSIQPYWNTYYYLNEAYKTQNPKVVAMEVYTAVEVTDEYYTFENAVKNIFGMNRSQDKKEAVDSSVDIPDRLMFYLEYPTFHKRYTDLEKNDFIADYEGDWYDHNCWKGETLYYHNDEGVFAPSDSDVYDTSIGKISAKNEEYLRKIIELTKEHGSELVLLVTPYVVLPGETAVFNRVAEIAGEYDVPFVNFNLYYDEMGIDFANDYAIDGCHMAYWGSEKFTRLFADMLEEEYDLPDRRGDEKYASYDRMVNAYKRMSRNQEISRVTELRDYVDMINDDNYVVGLSCVGDYKQCDNYFEIRDEIAKLGFDIDSVSGNGAFIRSDGQTVFETGDSTSYEYHVNVGKYDSLSVKPYERLNLLGENDILPQMRINTKTYSDCVNGIEIVVYDKILSDFVDHACFFGENNHLVTTRIK